MNTRLLSVLFTGALFLSACGGTSGTTETITLDTDTTTETEELVVGSGSISGAQVDYTIAYDSNKWTVAPATSNTDAEYEFEHVDGDVYAMVIPERITIEFDTLKELALDNALAVAPDAQVTFEEMRTVNGVEVLVMKTSGTMYGIAFEYYGYYYGGTAGTIQFIAYSSTDLVAEYNADITALLNGLTIKE